VWGQRSKKINKLRISAKIMKNANIIKLILLVVVLAVIAVVVVGRFGRVSPVKETMKLKVGTMPIGDCLSFFVAQEKGFFREEGLEVESVTMAGGAVIGPAIEKGELDIGWSNTVSVIIAHEEGHDFQFLTPGAFKDPKSADLFQLFVAKDSSIKEPKDVEGKKVAINTFKNIMELALRAWADKYNVDFSKINLVEVPFPEMESALETGGIDVAFAVEPYPTLAIGKGKVRVLDDRPFDALGERLMIASWIAKKSWIEKNPKQTKAFVNAINKANKYIIDNPAEMPEILTKYTRLTKETATQMTITSFFEHILKEDLQIIMDASYKYGYIKEKFDVKELVAKNLKLE